MEKDRDRDEKRKEEKEIQRVTKYLEIEHGREEGERVQNETRTQEKTRFSKMPLSFFISITAGVIAIVSGILTIAGNISILTFNSQSVLRALNSSGGVNSTTTAYLDLAFNGVSSVKNGIMVLAPLLVIAGIFLIISAFYLKSKSKESRDFGIFLTFLFSIFAVIGLLIYVPFNSLAVLILVYLPLTTLGQVTYILFIAYIVLGIVAVAVAVIKDKRYLF